MRRKFQKELNMKAREYVLEYKKEEKKEENRIKNEASKVVFNDIDEDKSKEKQNPNYVRKTFEEHRDTIQSTQKASKTQLKCIDEVLKDNDRPSNSAKLDGMKQCFQHKYPTFGIWD
jgi:ABC-type transporter MlaC component